MVRCRQSSLKGVLCGNVNTVVSRKKSMSSCMRFYSRHSLTNTQGDDHERDELKLRKTRESGRTDNLSE